jgi:transposase-like protein
LLDRGHERREPVPGVSNRQCRHGYDRSQHSGGSTNAIESLNARYRRAIKARGHFPSEQAALECLYLVTRSLDPTGAGRARWVTAGNQH